MYLCLKKDQNNLDPIGPFLNMLNWQTEKKQISKICFLKFFKKIILYYSVVLETPAESSVLVDESGR